MVHHNLQELKYHQKIAAAILLLAIRDLRCQYAVRRQAAYDWLLSDDPWLFVYLDCLGYNERHFRQCIQRLYARLNQPPLESSPGSRQAGSTIVAEAYQLSSASSG